MLGDGEGEDKVYREAIDYVRSAHPNIPFNGGTNEQCYWCVGRPSSW
jgi:hypothetical protein